MSIFTIPIGTKYLDEKTLREDKISCRKFGSCGAGREAMYLNSRFIDRRYYILWSEVGRVYKRVAMSEGGFTGKGVFGSLPFLVVEYNGTEREFPFKFEADVDRMLAYIEQEHPGIPIHSVTAQKKLAKSEAEEKTRYVKNLEPSAAEYVKALEADAAFLRERPSLYDAVASAAKQKRIIDNMPASYRLAGTLIAFGGIIAVLYGLFKFINHANTGIYFLIGGGAAFFMALSTNTLPSRYNSKQKAQEDWLASVNAMRDYLCERPEFFLPAHYAHPVAIARTVRVIREGRASDVEEAFDIMKEDLKALDSSVTVSQKEYDEIVEVKPMFLAADYRNEV